jgi:beta-1,4-mannosyl-glycoprotein beta-1,4-N-acetylglucosaminyltransferase
MSPLVIDTFSYNGEPILDLRMNILRSVVDKFVIIESLQTYAGTMKDKYHIDDWLELNKDYKSKIHVIKIDKFPKRDTTVVMESYMTKGSEDAWFREQYQRNISSEFLNTVTDDYILFVCDVDEIPNVNTIRNALENYNSLKEPHYMQMDFFYYNFLWKKKYQWAHAFCINNIGLSKHKFELSFLRSQYPKSCGIYTAGWHCSYFLSLSRIVDKLKSFAHVEFNRLDLLDNQHIYKCIMLGKDLLKRGPSEEMQPYNIQNLPLECQKFQILLHKLQTQ